jgi:CotH kinase protein
MRATRRTERSRMLIVALLLGVGASSAPAPAAAADSLARVNIHVKGAIPNDDKKTARMVVRDGTRRVYRGPIGIELRGQSSLRFPKQAWSVELRDRKGDNRDVSLLGMPADDDWVLYAGYNDKTLMRNVLAYETARRVGRYASRTRFVEVRLNGRYHGVYVLMEKLKLQADRIDLPEPAQLLEWTFAFQARTKGHSFALPVSGYRILFEDPERPDLARTRRAQVRRSIGAAERSLYARDFRHPVNGWRSHIDAAAAVDFILINELFKNQDAFHASTYLAQGANGLWQLGPVWDFDISMGNSDYGPSSRLTGSMLRERAWARRFYRDPEFVRAAAARWRDLRADGLRRDLLRSVARHAGRLAATGAAGRNFRRWPVLGVRVWPNPPAAVRRTTYGSEVDALRSWLKRRIGWMDRHVQRLGRSA